MADDKIARDGTAELWATYIAALEYVADMTCIDESGEWQFKKGYDPQVVLSALDSRIGENGEWKTASAERAKIVAWLRALSKRITNPDARVLSRSWASDIECGEHEGER